MEIMIFRSTLESMLQKVETAEKQEEARKRVQYTLNILGQETMSREAIATIIGSI